MSDPASYLTLEPGTEVVGADGGRVGAVEHVLRDESSDIFDGIVVDVSGDHRFVDAPEVAEIRADAVVLTLPSTQAERLPKPEANPAAMEHHGEEDSDSPLSQKLRRAWDLISGRY